MERARRRVRVRVRVRGSAIVMMALGLLVGLLPVSPAVAAESIQTKKVVQSRQKVLDYWTEERLENAQPADVDPAADESAETGSTSFRGSEQRGEPTTFEGTTSGTSSTSTTQRATERGTFPTEGKVFFTGSDGNDYVCSGTSVTSENESVVWTAGHCVHGGAGDTFHTNWIFVPGYDDGDAPYGVWTAEYLNTTGGWAYYSSFKYDFGAVVVSENDGETLNDAVGGEGIAFNQKARQNWTSLGYPAASPFDGEDLYGCDSRTGGRDNPDYLQGPKTLYINCNMTGGSSGGGWFMSQNGYRYVGSVNSYGYRGYEYMFGPYQGQAALNLYNAMTSL